jgi:hypothetical protein
MPFEAAKRLTHLGKKPHDLRIGGKRFDNVGEVKGLSS